MVGTVTRKRRPAEADHPTKTQAATALGCWDKADYFSCFQNVFSIIISFFNHNNSNNFTLRQSPQLSNLQSSSACSHVLLASCSRGRCFSTSSFSCQDLKMWRLQIRHVNYWPILRSQKAQPALWTTREEWLPLRWAACSPGYHGPHHPPHRADMRPCHSRNQSICHL